MQVVGWFAGKGEEQQNISMQLGEFTFIVTMAQQEQKQRLFFCDSSISGSSGKIPILVAEGTDAD